MGTGVRPRVYLAGPISGQAYDNATSWREDVREALDAYGIDAFSPMRAKRYLSESDEPIAARLGSEASIHPLSTPKGIVARDRFDVQKADLMLACFTWADRPSIGTAIEFGWADAARVPIVTVMQDGNPHWHDMIVELSAYIVLDLEQAIQICRAVLLPNPELHLRRDIFTQKMPAL